MKTKTKILASLEIAIVLCSVFLVALSAIAAEQSQAMQKVGANGVISASEDDYVLDIYGNANEDDTVDMRDLTYVKLIFFGKKPETELADAKYDGKINPLDFIQIKLIIVGKEKELTVVDSLGRIVTVKKPINRLIALGGYRTEAVKIVGAKDKIVGISDDILKKDYYYSKLLDKPTVGTWSTPDHEAIISLYPEIVITSANLGRLSELEEKLKPAGITVIGLDFYRDYLLKSEIEKLGYILNKRDEAREYIDWRGNYENQVKDFVEELTEDKKPRVLMEWSPRGVATIVKEPIPIFGQGSSGDYSITATGGRNIAAELPQYSKVGCEWVLTENPDVIIKAVSKDIKWGWESAEEPKKVLSETIKIRPGWDQLTAVKDNRFYIISSEIRTGPDGIVGYSYFAKWFHPELDGTIDPEDIYKEYVERFMDVEYPEDLIFAYPPPVS